MKNSILSVLVIGATSLSSCSDNGNKVESADAQAVVVNNEAQTSTFNKISESSQVDWRASHLGGAQPRYGKILISSVELSVNNKELVNATVVIDMNSFTVESFPEGDENIAKLTGHLKSPDFFEVAKYPTSTFELTSITKTTGDYNSEVTGNLTIMGIAKSITFQANISISESTVQLKSEDFAVNRADWNLTYNAEGTEGVPVDYLIASDIGFTIDVTVTN